MVAQRQRDTAAEMKVRRILHQRGMRYRIDYPVLRTPIRRADIAFIKSKVAVFIDGCFWHGCSKHGTKAKQNAKFWEEKIVANKNRDSDTNRRLIEKGWYVIRAWDMKIQRKSPMR